LKPYSLFFRGNIVYSIIQSFKYKYTARLEEDKYSCFDTNGKKKKKKNSYKKLSKTKIQLQDHTRRHQKIALGAASKSYILFSRAPN